MRFSGRRSTIGVAESREGISHLYSTPGEELVHIPFALQAGERLQSHEAGIPEVGIVEMHGDESFLEFADGVGEIVPGLVKGCKLFIQAEVNAIRSFIRWRIGIDGNVDAWNDSGHCVREVFHLVIPLCASRIDGQKVASC